MKPSKISKHVILNSFKTFISDIAYIFRIQGIKDSSEMFIINRRTIEPFNS